MTPVQPPDQVSKAHVLSRRVLEAGVSAEKIIAQAREDARKILLDAENKKKAIFDLAATEGRVQGLTELNNLICRLRTYYDELLRSRNDTIAELVAAACERIVRSHVIQNEAAIHVILNSLIDEFSSEQVLSIYVCPSDAGRIGETIGSGTEKTDTVDIVPCAELEPGDCILKTPAGEIRACLNDQFRALEIFLKQHSALISGGKETAYE